MFSKNDCRTYAREDMKYNRVGLGECDHCGKRRQRTETGYGEAVCVDCRTRQYEAELVA